MKRNLLLWLVIGLASTNFSRADDESEKSADQAADTSSIAGRVVDSTKIPLRNAQVWLHKFNYAPPGFGPVIAKSKVDGSGGFNFSNLAAGRYILAAEAEGLATSRSTVILLKAQTQKFEVDLRPSVQAAVKFQSESGQPIAGVKLRDLRYHDVNGDFYPYSPASQNLAVLGLNPEASETDGVMKLPQLPEGAVILTAIFDRPDFASACLEDVRVATGQIASVTMHSGIKLTLKFNSSVNGAIRGNLLFSIVNSDRRNPSTNFDSPIVFDDTGAATLNVNPGMYDLWLKGRDDDIITPEYGRCEISLGHNDTLTFTFHSKVQASGRVLNANTDEPVAKASVYAEISNQPWGGWASVASTKTGADGRYTLKVPAGPIRLYTATDDLAPVKPYIEREVLANGSSILPDLELLPIPKLNGRVVDPDGKPVAGAVVRLPGIYCLARQAPTATDRNGYFELQIRHVPSGFGLSSPQVLDVFHPTKPLSLQAEVHLDQTKSLTNMVLQLKPERCDEFLQRALAPLTDNERERLAERAESLKSFPSPIGRPALDLDGQAWLNTEKPMLSLADFRGKYVLLDFWAVWCGPCHADFPDIKLLYETYKDHGLVVIGVADNSTDPELVREHAKEQDLAFPIVVDQRDGRIFAAYQKFGIAQGIPSYVLIGPNGKILQANELQYHRIEYIRNYLFGNGLHKDGRE